jgi:hypothetical protein
MAANGRVAAPSGREIVGYDIVDNFQGLVVQSKLTFKIQAVRDVECSMLPS